MTGKAIPGSGESHDSSRRPGIRAADAIGLIQQFGIMARSSKWLLARRNSKALAAKGVSIGWITAVGVPAQAWPAHRSALAQVSTAQPGWSRIVDLTALKVLACRYVPPVIWRETGSR